MNCYFITGSSRGIGEALAELALERGDAVFGISRSHSIEHTNYEHFHLDLSDIEVVKAFEFPDLEAYNKIVLINNAGMLGEVRHVGKMMPEKILNTVEVNLVSPILLSNSFIKKYRDFEAAKMLVNVSSGAAHKPRDGWAIYCATKAGLEMFAKVLEKEQKLNAFQYPFMIYSIAPGVVDTKMQDELRMANGSDFSGIDLFKDLKANNELVAPRLVAEKYFRIIDNPKQYPELIQDVRGI